MRLTSSDRRVPLKSGDIVTVGPDKRYVIDRHLASGGFSLLYLAHPEGSGRYVALKEYYPREMEDAVVLRLENGAIGINSPFGGDPDAENAAFRERGRCYFRREVDMTEKAGVVFDREGHRELQNHGDILRVEGPMEDLRGNLYLAVDTVQGESLGDLIHRGFVRDGDGRIASNLFLREIIEILKQTAIRLSALHESARIYHLDLSADNIYLGLAGGKTCLVPYIIDYGAACDAEAELRHPEHRYTVNPHSAPEVLALGEFQNGDCGYGADESSDTYSLVSILFYAATGRIFTAENRAGDDRWQEQIRRAYSAGFPARHGTSTFADSLIAFFRKGLSADQKKRFTDAKALLDGLTELEIRRRMYGNLLPLVKPDELMSYLVLEKHPLYRYRDASGNVHVLCLGSGVFVRRMILSMISCGQIAGSCLHIHIVSRMSREAFAADLLNEAPGLKEYSNLGENPIRNYVNFTYEEVRDLADPAVCRDVLRRYSDARYLLISLGKNRLNVETADRCGLELLNLRTGENRETIINYYSAEDAANNTFASRLPDRLPRWLEIDAFSEDLTGYTTTLRELGLRTLKLAHLYNRLGEDGITLAQSAERLMSDEYGQRSSCAAALHLKYKLAGLGIDPEGVNTTKQAGCLGFVPFSEKERGILLENEHRRWMMYMISDGYRLPTDQELEEYGFETVDGKFNGAWRCKQKKLHPCLVPCSDAGLELTTDHWQRNGTMEEIESLALDELDKMSLKLNMMAREKCADIAEDRIVGTLFRKIRRKLTHAKGKVSPAENPEKLATLLDEVESRVLEAVEDLRYPENGGELSRLKTAFAEVGFDIGDITAQIQQTLAVFAEYTARKDYKAPDLTIIENLLWLLYSESDLTMIRLAGVETAEDALAAMILEPGHLIRVGDEADSRLETLLAASGCDARLEVVRAEPADREEWYELLRDLISDQWGRVVIDCSGADGDAIAAADRVCGEFGRVCLVRGRTGVGLENLKGFELVQVYGIRAEFTRKNMCRVLKTFFPG